MLDFQFWSIFEAVANTLILFVLLRIFLFKPINKMMNERTQNIQNDIDSAKKAKDEAEMLRQQYENSVSEAKEKANEIIMKMAERGIATNVHYKPLPMHTAYKKLGFDIANYPVAYQKYVNSITLPLHTKLSDEDIEYVI